MMHYNYVLIKSENKDFYIVTKRKEKRKVFQINVELLKFLFIK